MKELKETLQVMLEKSKDPAAFKANSEILRRKIEKKIIYPDITEEQFKELKAEVLRESVFDPIQNTRSEDVFDNRDVIKKEVADFIVKTLNDWRNQLEVKFEVRNLFMVGSMTGFQYNKTSDIDINVFTDIQDEKIVNKLRGMLPNGNPLPGTNHAVNFWFGGANDEIKAKNKENIYNIMTDNWEKKSEKKDIKIPYPYIMEVSKFFMDGFDLAISECERDIIELNIHMDYDPSRQQVTEKEKREFVSKKVDELKADIDRLRVGKHILRSFMIQGYEDMPFRVSINYEHEDPRYSMNAMVYKMIDRLGYHDDKIPTQIKKAAEAIKKAEAYLSSEVVVQEQSTPKPLLEEVKPLRSIKIKKVK
jgi:hypothetical protein